MEKVAIPSLDNKGLNSSVFEHFGRAPYFTLITIEGGKITNIEVLENPQAVGHAHGALPKYLSEMNVTTIIALGMGIKAKERFQQLGIKVITGASGKISEVIEAFLKGKLVTKPYEPGCRCRHSHD